MSAKSRTKAQTDSSAETSANTTVITEPKSKAKTANKSSDKKAQTTVKSSQNSSGKSKKAQTSTHSSASVVPQKTQKPSVAKAKSEKQTGDEVKDATEFRPACKTPQVMKLVQDSLDLNPVLLAGKSRIPSRLRGKESLTRIMRRDMGEEFEFSEDSIVVNITELAIAQETPIILDRFNACSCDKCIEVFSRIIASKVPVRFARIGRNGRSPDNRDLSERVAPMRKIVLTEMIKELICSKKRWFHDDN